MREIEPLVRNMLRQTQFMMYWIHSGAGAHCRPLACMYVRSIVGYYYQVPKWLDCCDDRISYQVVPLKKAYVVEAMLELKIVGSHQPLKRHGGIGRSAKFFLPDLLPQYKQVMFWDTDVVLREPISRVWKLFTQFEESHLFAATRLDDPEKPDRMGTGMFRRKIREGFVGFNHVQGHMCCVYFEKHTRVLYFLQIRRVRFGYRMHSHREYVAIEGDARMECVPGAGID